MSDNKNPDPAGTGWVEGMDAADDGYLASGQTIEIDPMREIRTPNAGGEPPPPMPDDPSGTGSGAGRKRMIRMAAGGAVILAAGAMGWHYLHGGSSVQSVPPPIHRTAQSAPGSGTGGLSSMPAVKPPTAVASAVGTMSALPAPVHPSNEPVPIPPDPANSPIGGPAPLPVSASGSDASDLRALKLQIDSLESQVSGLRQANAQDQHSRKLLVAQIASLKKALADVNRRISSRVPARHAAVSRAGRDDRHEAVRGEVARAQAPSPAFRRDLNGYRLLDVVGSQAVVEDLSTGKVAVLSANQRLGSLTVYQVTEKMVVTNYGIF